MQERGKRLLKKLRTNVLIQRRKENQEDLERSLTVSKENALSAEMGDVGQKKIRTV